MHWKHKPDLRKSFNNVVDYGGYDLAKGTTHDDGDCQIHHVTIHGELFELFYHAHDFLVRMF